MNAGMSGLLMLLFLFSATLNSALAQCTLDDIGCCLTEFTSIIKPSVISLSEQRVAAVCTLEDETLECLELFTNQCLKNETDRKDVEDIVNRTKAYISQICPPTSDFMTKLKADETCILGTSQKFQTCYNKTILPSSGESEERLKRECCEYKDLRDCAVQTVKDSCGVPASQLVHEEVVHMNGAVLEWTCSDVFSKCPNSAMMLASSALLLLYSIAVLKFLL